MSKPSDENQIAEIIESIKAGITLENLIKFQLLGGYCQIKSLQE